MKPIPTLLTFAAMSLMVSGPSLLRADDAPNRRDFKNPAGGIILIGGSDGTSSPSGSTTAPNAGQSSPSAGSAAVGNEGSAVAATPAVPATPPPPPPQRPSDHRAFNNPDGGLSISFPNLLTGPSVPDGPPKPGNRRDIP